MKRLLALIMLIGVTFANPVHAVQPGEILADPALEARARALSAELRCLVCQNQSIDDSDADLARDLRVLIREQLVQKKSDQEIMDFVVARYGEYVLLKPRLSGKTLILWFLPFAVLLAAAGGMLAARRRSAAEEAGLTPEEQARVDDLLKG